MMSSAQNLTDFVNHCYPVPVEIFDQTLQGNSVMIKQEREQGLFKRKVFVVKHLKNVPRTDR